MHLFKFYCVLLCVHQQVLSRPGLDRPLDPASLDTSNPDTLPPAVERGPYIAAAARESLEPYPPDTSTASIPRVVKRNDGWIDHVVNLGPPDWTNQNPRRKMATYNEVDRQIARHGRPGGESSLGNMCVVLCAAVSGNNYLVCHHLRPISFHVEPFSFFCPAILLSR